MDVLESCEVCVQEHLESLVDRLHKAGILYREAVAEFRRAFIGAALRENRGNLSKTAPQLGLHRNTLTRLCEELEVEPRNFRPASRRPPKSAHTPVMVKRAAR
jgi:DNA-binding NtrC family response regulator